MEKPFKEVLIFTLIYPLKDKLHSGIFIKNLLDEFEKRIDHINIIKPISIFKRESVLCEANSKKRVFSPRYFVYGFFKFGFIEKNFLLRLNTNLILCQAKRLKLEPDFIYCHFLSAAYLGYDYSLYKKRPLIIAIGENNDYLHFLINYYGIKHSLRILNYSSAIISVSENNKKILLQYDKGLEKKIHVIPNAINSQIFYPRDEKVQLRKKYKLPLDKFIVCFIGHFDERKGAYRVLEAIEHITEVYGIFIGSGNWQTTSPRVIIRGVYSKGQIADLLNAADIFVLPTQAEGMSNAINEAMGCGLPIVSSNIASVQEQLDGTEAILVDPNNIDEIREAIELFKEDQILRNRVKTQVINKIKNNTIELRAEKILSIIRKIINE